MLNSYSLLDSNSIHRFPEHYSVFEPMKYEKLFGETQFRLDALRAGMFSSMSKCNLSVPIGLPDYKGKSFLETLPVEEHPRYKSQSHSLLWYWSKIAMYRDIVHQFLRPRHAHTYLSKLDPAKYGAGSNTSVRFVVTESQATLHLLLNYAECELGPEANTLLRPDFGHILFVDDLAEMREYSRITKRTGETDTANLFYFPEFRQHVDLWQRMSQDHGFDYCPSFYSLWNDQVQATEKEDIAHKRELLDDLFVHRRRGYLRRALSNEEIYKFLREQDALRATNEDHPCAYVFLTTSAFLRWLPFLELNHQRISPTSLLVINDGTFDLFDKRSAVQKLDPKTDFAGNLRHAIALQFQFVHTLSCTPHMLLGLVYNLPTSTFYQRSAPLSMTLFMISNRTSHDAWYMLFDFLMVDLVTEVYSPENNKKQTPPALTFGLCEQVSCGFRVALLEWKRAMSLCSSSSSLEGAGAGAATTHVNYEEVITQLCDHESAPKFSVTEFVNAVNHVVETWIYAPICAHMLENVRLGNRPCVEMIHLLTLPFYSVRNGYSVDHVYLPVEELWFSASASLPQLFSSKERLKQEKSSARSSRAAEFRQYEKVVISDAEYNAVKLATGIDCGASDLTRSGFFKGFRSFPQRIREHCVRDAVRAQVYADMFAHSLFFTLEEARAKLEDDMQTDEVARAFDSGGHMQRLATSVLASASRSMRRSAAFGSRTIKDTLEFMEKTVTQDHQLNLTVCTCADPNCRQTYTCSLAATLARLNVKEAVAISKVLARGNRSSLANEEKEYLQGLRLLKYADVDFNRQLRLRKGELGMMASPPGSAYSVLAPSITVQSVLFPKQDDERWKSLLSECLAGAERTLILCSDELQQVLDDAAATTASLVAVVVMTMSSFLYGKKAKTSPPLAAKEFERIVFFGDSCVLRNRRRTLCIQGNDLCTGCMTCKTVIEARRDDDGHHDEDEEEEEHWFGDPFLQEEKALRFFRDFFEHSSPRHIWIYESMDPKEHCASSTYDKLWCLANFGKFDLDWSTAAVSSRRMSDLVLKLLWGCRVPRSSLVFRANIAEELREEYLQASQFREMEEVLCKERWKDYCRMQTDRANANAATKTQPLSSPSSSSSSCSSRRRSTTLPSRNSFVEEEEDAPSAEDGGRDDNCAAGQQQKQKTVDLAYSMVDQLLKKRKRVIRHNKVHVESWLQNLLFSEYPVFG